jgi:DNA-binding Lrp family transcriptional regulator
VKDVQDGLADVDRKIIGILRERARTPNAAIAEAVGIAPSTCLGRIRALEEAGVIRGYHADIDPAAMGRPIQAMIAVRLRAGARGKLQEFIQTVRARPEVLEVFFLGGTDDFLIHVAVADTAELRDFVIDPLSAYPEVGSTQTNLIFEHI